MCQKEPGEGQCLGEAGFEWLARHHRGMSRGHSQGRAVQLECRCGAGATQSSEEETIEKEDGDRRPRTGAQTPGWRGERPGRQRGSENNSPGAAEGMARDPAGPLRSLYMWELSERRALCPPLPQNGTVSPFLARSPAAGLQQPAFPGAPEGGGRALSLVSVATHPGWLPNDGTPDPPDPPLSCRDESGHRRLGRGGQAGAGLLPTGAGGSLGVRGSLCLNKWGRGKLCSCPEDRALRALLTAGPGFPHSLPAPTPTPALGWAGPCPGSSEEAPETKVWAT